MSSGIISAAESFHYINNLLDRLIMSNLTNSMRQLSIDTSNNRQSVDSVLDENRLPSWAQNPEEIYSSAATNLRRKSQECCSVETKIVGTETIQNHVYYHIQVTSAFKVWVIKRRFSDFIYIDKKLRKIFPHIILPNLPEKTYFTSSTNPQLVDERSGQLETYLRSLVPIPVLWTKNDIVQFLDNESNAMMFLWNLERIRKMQEVRIIKE